LQVHWISPVPFAVLAPVPPDTGRKLLLAMVPETAAGAASAVVARPPSAAAAASTVTAFDFMP